MTLAPVDLNHGISPVPRFCQPQLPTARIFHEVRLAHSITRPELVKATGLSQPTVTRGIAALIDAGLITERPDLIFNTTGGRPRIPLTLANPPWFHIGFHLGLHTSRIAVFDVAGRAIRETDVPLALDSLTASDALSSLLDERARLLGVAIARIADIVGPAQVVLAGAAFTDDPVGLRQVARSVQEESIVPRQLLVSRARQHITRDAARAVAMDPLYFDPIALATGSH